MAKTVLTVDDSASIRQMVSFTLKSAGYEVVEAVDGMDGLEKAKGKSFNLVLTDQNMPRMDGMELLRELKSALAPSLPVIMLTAYTSDETALEAKKLGAFAYMAKPFDVAALLGVVKRALSAEER